MNLKLRKAIGFVARLFSPGYGACVRCGRPWSVCEMHITEYEANRSGCFVFCEACWPEQTPAERLPEYMRMVDRWKSRAGCDLTDKRKAIRRAVMEGK